MLGLLGLVKVIFGSGQQLRTRSERSEAGFCFSLLSVFRRLWPNIQTLERATWFFPTRPDG